MIASTFLCSIVIGFVCNKMVDHRFGKYEGENQEKLEAVSEAESKGLRNAGIAALIYLSVIVIGYFFGPLALIKEDGARAVSYTHLDVYKRQLIDNGIFLCYNAFK